jgi:hypothetical protein
LVSRRVFIRFLLLAVDLARTIRHFPVRMVRPVAAAQDQQLLREAVAHQQRVKAATAAQVSLPRVIRLAVAVVVPQQAVLPEHCL